MKPEQEKEKRRQRILTEPVGPLLIKTALPTMAGMLGLLAGMLGNIVLDPLFILVFKMGIRGAGIATLIGQAGGCVLLCALSFRHGNIPVGVSRCRLSGGRLGHILLGGAPNFSRQGITSLAGVLLNRAAAPFGDSVIASLTISSRVAALAYLIMIGFGQGFQPICAMNYGAKQYTRVRRAFRLAVRAGTVFLAAAAAVIAVFAEKASGLFTANLEVTEITAAMLRLQCLSLPFLCFYALSGMYMQNIGEYKKAILISILRQGLVYLPLLLILPALFGAFGICLLQPAADILSFLLSLLIMLPQLRKMREWG